jgi:hypothetical protein
LLVRRKPGDPDPNILAAGFDTQAGTETAVGGEVRIVPHSTDGRFVDPTRVCFARLEGAFSH